MKITETITPINSGKTLLGDKDIKLTLDTDTNELTIDAPAMFVDPTVNLDEFEEKISELKSIRDRERERAERETAS
jgi:hypothetical protein